MATKLIFMVEARSRMAAMPRPEDCKVASSWRFLISSTDSAYGRYSTLPMSSYLRPAAAKIARALSSVPDFAAPTEIRLPLRSAKVLMPDSSLATIWM
ncbi:hypothetical protein D9M71_745610 [compost metagenome]